MLSTRVLTDWENETQALWMNANFQWQLTQHFAIDLERHSPITINFDPVGGFKMYCWVMAKKAEGQRRKLTKAVHRPATYKAHYIEARLVHVGLWNQDQTACVALDPRYNDPLDPRVFSTRSHVQ